MDEMLQKEDILITGQRDQVVQQGKNLLQRWDALQKTKKEVPKWNLLQKVKGIRWCNRGKPTPKMGQTAEDKEGDPQTESAAKQWQTIGKDQKSGRMEEGLPHGHDAAEGGESSGGNSTENSPKKSKSRKATKHKRTKKKKRQKQR